MVMLGAYLEIYKGIVEVDSITIAKTFTAVFGEKRANLYQSQSKHGKSAK